MTMVIKVLSIKVIYLLNSDMAEKRPKSGIKLHKS